MTNWRFNENDIAFGIVGIDEIERIHRELAYACAELGANRFEHRFRIDIAGGSIVSKIFRNETGVILGRAFRYRSRGCGL